MISKIKKVLYFPIASYFRFFAKLRLRKWKPRVVVVTGSNGKTTLLHMLEAQIGDNARYSHHANSSFGIPFDILDLHRKTLSQSEWLSLILKTPFAVFKKIPKEKIYIVEADCDRLGEGKFLAELLKPEIVLWVSVSRTHSLNFDSLVEKKKFSNVEEAIAYEFGYFLEYCSKLSVLNGDSDLMLKQKNRTKAEVNLIKKERNLKKYSIKKSGVEFLINTQKYEFQSLLPEDVFCSIEMCRLTVNFLQLTFDPSFKNFVMPPGRGSIFEGIKNTTIIDSSYNANLGSITVILNMYKKFPSDNKWVVIGDMLELGKVEKEEHEKLAKILLNTKLENIILVGKLTNKYTYPFLKDISRVVSFESGRQALEYLEKNLKGHETVLFKGSQSLFLEGIIEKLLKQKNDIVKLPRQIQFWKDVRKIKGY